ncbi:MAG: ATP-binding protein [Bacteroidales bacterium]
MFTNLLSNAIKYTPANGRVDVILSINFGIQHPHFSPSDGCVEISVKNTGDGIPREKIPYIFDRYYRVDNELTEKETEQDWALHW